MINMLQDQNRSATTKVRTGALHLDDPKSAQKNHFETFESCRFLCVLNSYVYNLS